MAETNHHFSDDVRINKYKLDEECEKHSSLYYYWAEKNADAKKILSQSEDLLKYTLAETEITLRKNWDDSKDGKQTENGIKAKLENHPNIRKIKEQIIENQHQVNILSAAVSAMEHRKSELNNLVSLQIGGFYSTPTGIKKPTVTDQSSRDQKKKLNKREDD
jgi:hypothetical protein